MTVTSTSHDVEVNFHPYDIARPRIGYPNRDAALVNPDLIGNMKRAQDVGVGKRRILDRLFQLAVGNYLLQIEIRIEPDAHRAQKYRRQKLSFAYAYVEKVLLVILELDPRAAIWNDLCHVEHAAFEKYAGRAMQLRDDNALGSVDDKGPVIGHQRNLTKEDLFLFDIPNIERLGVGVFVIDRKPDLDLERHAVRHASLLALLLVMFVL